MNSDYLYVKLDRPEQTVTLRHPIPTQGTYEMGVIHTVLPRKLGNFNAKEDFVKCIYPRITHTLDPMHCLLRYNTSIADTFKHGFRYKSGFSITYDGTKFILRIPAFWMVQLSERLSRLSGLPKVIREEYTEGLPVQERYFEATKVSEYLRFFRFKPETKHFRVPTAIYYNLDTVKVALRRQGYKKDDYMQTLVSSSLKQKMRHFPHFKFLIVASNVLAHRSFMNQKREFTLKVIPAFALSVAVSQSVPVQTLYKRIRNSQPVTNMQFSIRTDTRTRIYFEGSFYLTLHIRSHAPQDRALL
jgi:hypothetical protein